MRDKGTRLKSAPRLKLSEADLERQCSDLLALDGWRSLKTDPVSRREWGKGFGEKGMADRLYIRYDYTRQVEFCSVAQVMWIEWKSARGTLKPHQAGWIGAERARGALVVIAQQDFAPTFDSFCTWYSESGLLRRAGLCKTSSTKNGSLVSRVE